MPKQSTSRRCLVHVPWFPECSRPIQQHRLDTYRPASSLLGISRGHNTSQVRPRPALSPPCSHLRFRQVLPSSPAPPPPLTPFLCGRVSTRGRSKAFLSILITPTPVVNTCLRGQRPWICSCHLRVITVLWGLCILLPPVTPGPCRGRHASVFYRWGGRGGGGESCSMAGP